MIGLLILQYPVFSPAARWLSNCAQLPHGRGVNKAQSSSLLDLNQI